MSQPGSDSRATCATGTSSSSPSRHDRRGLFLGSAKGDPQRRTGLLLAYALGGVAIFFIMRALGELLTYRPVAGSFATYADEFCGPFAGFVTGWSTGSCGSSWRWRS